MNLKPILTIPMTIILAGMFVLAAMIIDRNHGLKQQQHDLAELQNARYQLVDASVWVAKITEIAEREIDTFELKGKDRDRAKHVLAKLFIALATHTRQQALDNTGAEFREMVEILKGKKSFRDLGFRGLIDLTAAFGENFGETAKNALKVALIEAMDLTPKRAEEYAEDLIARAEQDDVKQEIKALAKSALAGWSETNFGQVDRAPLDAVLARYQCPSPQDCRALLENSIAAGRENQMLKASGIGAGMLFLLLAAGFTARTRNRTTAQIPIILASIGSLALLAPGVMASVITIEARVEEFSLTLLSHPITFTDQLLYYRNKSIVEVIVDLIRSPDTTLLLVGVGILAFSLVVPSLKMIGTIFAVCTAEREPWLVSLLARDSAKWAMADVFVAAVVLAYFGMDGIIGQQTALLSHQSSASTDIISTGGSSLEIGFVLFAGFALSGLLISECLKLAKPRNDP